MASKSSSEVTNLVVLRKNRKPIRPGDFFVFKMIDERYRFGRVVITDISGDPWPGANLVYVYDSSASEPQLPPQDQLRPDRLLIPPLWINLQGWWRGYFQPLGNQPLTKSDVLNPHCFWESLTERFLDEHGNALSATHTREQCGVWGLSSHRGLESRVSKAIGLAPVRGEKDG